MSKTEILFFELLRAGLWGSRAVASLFEGEVDWKGILKLAEKQTVVGLVADGIYSLPEDRQPPKEIQYKLHLYLVRLQQSHQLLNQVLKELVTFFQKNQISSILLKGQGLAQIYPKPERRGCGDIDLYVGKENYEKACELIKDFGVVTEGLELESEKHFHCQRNGVTIEIHRLAESQFNPLVDARFQKWTKWHLDKNEQHRTWNLDDCVVALPPVQFDALYILNHLTHHFVSLGVGLRQVCDWIRYLSVFRDKIDYELLCQDLKRFGMWKYWQVFGAFAVGYLGFPADRFPFYSSSYRREADKLWCIISKVGNFGKYAGYQSRPRPTTYIRRKLHTFYHQLTEKREVMGIFPAETIGYLWWYTLDGIKRVCIRK